MSDSSENPRPIKPCIHHHKPTGSCAHWCSATRFSAPKRCILITDKRAMDCRYRNVPIGNKPADEIEEVPVK